MATVFESFAAESRDSPWCSQVIESREELADFLEENSTLTPGERRCCARVEPLKKL